MRAKYPTQLIILDLINYYLANKAICDIYYYVGFSTSLFWLIIKHYK
jgi:hypothetical protein